MKFVECDLFCVEEFVERFKKIEIFNGDGVDYDMLVIVGFLLMDMVIVVMSDNEMNIMVSVLVK